MGQGRSDPLPKPPHHFTSGSWDNANARYHPANSWDATNSGQDTSSCHRGDGDCQLGVTGAQPASPPPSLGGREQLPLWGDG